MWAGQAVRQGTTFSACVLSSRMIFTESMIDPVGQTSMQAPQKRQPASFSDFPSGMPARMPISV